MERIITKPGDEVVCIGEYCYDLKQYEKYIISGFFTDNTITLEGKNVHYSLKHFITLKEYRKQKIENLNDLFGDSK